MGIEINQLHVLFFPLMAQGHMLPILDMAKLFALRGVNATIVTTPINAPLFSKSIQKIDDSSVIINLKIFSFPAKEVGLAEGLENLDNVTNLETYGKFFGALPLFQGPLEELFEDLRPHALVADWFFPWAVDAASKYAIPSLSFKGTGFFSMCANESVMKYSPHKSVSSDTEKFILPGLPDQIKLTRLQLFEHLRVEFENGFTRLLNRAMEMERRSYGMIVNSFYELELGYVEHWNVLKNRAWHIGPLSLCKRDKIQRGKETSIDQDDFFKWLDSKNPNSVVYICFGTSTKFSDSQLYEIAMGLEASGQQFIWVVRKEKKKEEGEEKWLPEGFEERIEGKGLIIRGWAPQVLILDHEAVGGFVTHCGWNSVLEGVSAGLPLVTWPVFAEQFYNEKLITDVLRIGVGVGAEKWVRFEGDFIRREAIAKAVKEIMVGEKAGELRNRAKALGEKARRAIEEGGSSYSDLSALIEELRHYQA